jgi:hypothetical protein
MRKLVWCAFVAALSACDDVPSVVKDAGLPDLRDAGFINDAGMIVIPQIPLPVPLDLALLPNADGAKKLLVEAAGARLEIDPTSRDAITALGECLDLVSYCYEPAQRSLQSCVKSAKSCTTSTPWTESSACCPAAIFASSAVLHAAGTGQVEAFEEVFFTNPECFPGVKEAL